MKFDKNKPITVTIGNVRAVFPFVFEKRPDEKGMIGKYEVTLLIDKKDTPTLETINAAIDEAIDRGYSGDLKPQSTFKKNTKESDLQLPLHEDFEKEDTDYFEIFEGSFYMNAKTDRRPTVVDTNGQQILDPDEIYGGCFIAISLTFFPYNNRAEGVSAQINHIMKLKDGDRIGGGGISVEEAFKDYIGNDNGGGRSRGRRERDNDDQDNGRGRDRGRSEDRGRERINDREESTRSEARGGTRGRGEGRRRDDPMFD